MKHRAILLFVSAILVSVCVAQPVYDATMLGYVGLHYVCPEGYTPVVRVKNTGTAPMNSCVVETWKNGVPTGSFDWQLAAVAQPGVIREPALPIVPNATLGDVLEFRIISVNNQPDEDASGNSITITLDQVPSEALGYMVMVEVLTDADPGETTWEVRDALARVVASGGPYTASSTVHTDWATLDAGKCYQLQVYDAAGNGLPGGHVGIYSNAVEVLTVVGGDFTSMDAKGFITGIVTGTMDDRWGTGGLDISPVPSTGFVRLATDQAVGPFVLEVRDASGRLVRTERGNASGHAPFGLDLSGCPAGTYALTLRDDREAVLHGRLVLMH